MIELNDQFAAVGPVALYATYAFQAKAVMLSAENKPKAAEVHEQRKQQTLATALTLSKDMPEFHREWVEQGLLEVDNFAVNLLDVPNYYSLKVLPTWKKKKIEQVLLEHIVWLEANMASKRVIDDYKNAITFMYDAEDSDQFRLWDEFRQRNDRLDEIRGENFLSVFPEHRDLFDA